jgi:hypothetical protein
MYRTLAIQQKKSIQNMDFYYFKLLSTYQQLYGIDSINVFDNDLALAINYGDPLYRQVSPYLMKNKKLLDLLQTLPSNAITHTYNIWCYLSYKKKQIVYTYLMDRV